MKTNLILLSIFLLIIISSCKKKSTCDVGVSSYPSTMVGTWQVGTVITTFYADSTFKDSSVTFFDKNDTAYGTWKFSGYYLVKQYNVPDNYGNSPNIGFVDYDIKQLCPTTVQMQDNNLLNYNGTKIHQ
jgi:hypothetical protein